MTRAGAGGAAARLVSVLHRHPWHVLTAAALFGLVAGPLLPWAAVALLAVIAGLAPGRTLGAACAVAVLLGGAWSVARIAALDHPQQLPPSAAVGIAATLTESPRATAFGWRALARARDAPLLVRGAGRPPAWWPGDDVRVAGSLHVLGPHDGWLRARHVTRIIDARFARRTGRRREGAVGAIDDLRRRASRALSARLPVAEGRPAARHDARRRRGAAARRARAVARRRPRAPRRRQRPERRAARLLVRGSGSRPASAAARGSR